MIIAKEIVVLAPFWNTHDFLKNPHEPAGSKIAGT